MNEEKAEDPEENQAFPRVSFMFCKGLWSCFDWHHLQVEETPNYKIVCTRVDGTTMSIWIK